MTAFQPGSGPGAARPQRILMMGPNHGGKTSMAKVIFENWEPARTQYQGKTSGKVLEEVFLLGRLFSFTDCGGQVSYFDDYLRDPFLFVDVAALVFVVDASLFFQTASDDSAVATTSSSATAAPAGSLAVGGGGNNAMDGGADGVDGDSSAGGGGGAPGGSRRGGTSVAGRGWTPQIICDVFARVMRVLRERSPAAHVCLMLNKMDRVGNAAAAALNRDQAEAVLADYARRLQLAAYSCTAADAASVSAEHLDAAVPLYRTSIFNSSIVVAWSQVVARLLQPDAALATLRAWLDRMRESSGGEILEASLLDSATLLCVAVSSVFPGASMASEVAIRAKRQRLKGMLFAEVTDPLYTMVWQPCVGGRLQLLLVGDGRLTTPGVTQLNAQRVGDWLHAMAVDPGLAPPWSADVVQVRQLLGTM